MPQNLNETPAGRMGRDEPGWTRTAGTPNSSDSIMNPASITIDFVEQCLSEGRLNDITNLPPFVGPFATIPRLSGPCGIFAKFPEGPLRHARVWTRVKRALREAQWPNPHRANRENHADPEFLTRNLGYLMLKHLGVTCDFQWPLAPSFRYHTVVFPTDDGQTSPLAREHIYRAGRNIWSLAMFPMRESKMDLIVPENQIWRGDEDAGSSMHPWQTHAAYLGGIVIVGSPFNSFVLAGWVGAEELTCGEPCEHTYDYTNRHGESKIGRVACRRVAPWQFRPMTELLQMLRGWDLVRLQAENRFAVGGMRFGLKSQTNVDDTGEGMKSEAGVSTNRNPGQARNPSEMGM